MRERTPEQQARWILAYVLDWHRREEKAVWWEYFRLSALATEDLLEEKAGLANLMFFERSRRNRQSARSTATGFRRKRPSCGAMSSCISAGATSSGRWNGSRSKSERSTSRSVRTPQRSIPKPCFHTMSSAPGCWPRHWHASASASRTTVSLATAPYAPRAALLLRERPQLGGEPLRLPDETTLAAATRIAPKLEGGVLPIQGPPGTGKTHIGARMICALVKAGAKVGITATSHKVIRNLLNAVLEAAAEAGQSVRCIQKVDGDEEDQPHLTFAESNDEVFAALQGTCDVAAGTAWLWARPEAQDSVDVLFVDEAAQMSLANVLAVSHAGKTLVLLGDPRQLDQPTKGTHPEGTSVSALDYILNGQQTIGAEQGLFLEDTWRLHPEICAFTSELFYESRLKAIPGLERQEVRSRGRVQGAGLRYVPVTIRAIRTPRLKRRK